MKCPRSVYMLAVGVCAGDSKVQMSKCSAGAPTDRERCRCNTTDCVNGVPLRKRRCVGRRGSAGVDQGAGAVGPAAPPAIRRVRSLACLAPSLRKEPASFLLCGGADHSRVRRDDLLQTPGPRTGDTRDARWGTNTFLRRPVTGAGAPSESDAAQSPRALVPEPPSASTLQVTLHRATMPLHLFQGHRSPIRRKRIC